MLGTLTLDQLRILVTIEETGSFSAAGRKLQRAQAALSHAAPGARAAARTGAALRRSRTPPRGRRRILVASEEAGSFSAAGRKLQRAQSAISHAVQSLE